MILETLEELKEYLKTPSPSKISEYLDIPQGMLNYRIRKPITGQVYSRNFVNYNELFKLLKGKPIDDIIKLNTKYSGKKTKYRLKLILNRLDNHKIYLKENNCEISIEKINYMDCVKNEKIYKNDLYNINGFIYTFNYLFNLYLNDKLIICYV